MPHSSPTLTPLYSQYRLQIVASYQLFVAAGFLASCVALFFMTTGNHVLAVLDSHETQVLLQFTVVLVCFFDFLCPCDSASRHL